MWSALSVPADETQAVDNPIEQPDKLLNVDHAPLTSYLILALAAGMSAPHP